MTDKQADDGNTTPDNDAHTEDPEELSSEDIPEPDDPDDEPEPEKEPD